MNGCNKIICKYLEKHGNDICDDICKFNAPPKPKQIQTAKTPKGKTSAKKGRPRMENPTLTDKRNGLMRMVRKDELTREQAIAVLAMKRIPTDKLSEGQTEQIENIWQERNKDRD